MRFALLSLVPRVTVADLQALAAAITPLLAYVAEVWREVLPDLTTPTVRVVDKIADLTDADTPILFVEAFAPKDAGDLAYHAELAGADGRAYPYALVLADAFQGLDKIMQAAAHEMLEATIDPDCNAYDDGIAREIADPVQDDAIRAHDVLLTAWVGPRWFGLSTTGRVAYSDAGFDLAPGAIRPGGYFIRQDGTEVPAGYQPDASRDHPRSRRARRLAALAATS